MAQTRAREWFFARQCRRVKRQLVMESARLEIERLQQRRHMRTV